MDEEELELEQPVEIVGLREFAKIVGVSLAAIQKAISSGRITAVINTRKGRKLVKDDALVQWEAARSSRAPAVNPVGPSPDGVKLDPEALVSDEGLPWGAQKTKEEALLAARRRTRIELEIAELEGELHRADDVAAVWADLLVRFRAKCLGLPSTVAPIIAAIPVDKEAIQAHIDRSLRDALRDLVEENQVQAMADRLMPVLLGIAAGATNHADAARIQAELEIHMREALSELANYDPRQIQAAAKKRAKSS